MKKSRSARRHRSVLASATLIFGVASFSAHAAREPVEITACGAVFTERTDAYLAADLDCSDWEYRNERSVVRFLTRGTLDLRGFTLTGGAGGASGSRVLVECDTSCEIAGNGGRLVGGTFGAIADRKVTVVDAEISGMSHRGVRGRRAEIENVTITGSGTEAITGARVVIRNSLIANNGGYPQPDTGQVRLTSAVIFGGTIRVFDSTIIDNAWGGIEADRVRIVNSTVTGNGTYFECGVTRDCRFDIGSDFRARAVDSVCGRSLDLTSCGCNGDSEVTPETDPANHNWGICSLD